MRSGGGRDCRLLWIAGRDGRAAAQAPAAARDGARRRRRGAEASRLAESVLRGLPQLAHGAAQQRSRQPRDRQRLRPPAAGGDLGARAAKARGPGDAAPGDAAPGRDRVRRVHEMAGRFAGPGVGRSGPARRVRAPSPEPGGIRQRDPRPPGAGRRRGRSAAERRRQFRLRQHRRFAADVSIAAGTLCDRGATHQRAGGRRPRDPSGHHRLRHQPRGHAERSRRGAAAGHARRQDGPAHLSRRRRIRAVGTAEPHGAQRLCGRRGLGSPQ